jgi:transposase-like protein
VAQHFLHRASTRDFSIFDATDLSGAKAVAFLAQIRWGADNTQICPTCGVVDSHYFRENRCQWRCRSCDAYFSITSGTIFQDRKVPLRTIITAVFLYANSANGLAAVELARTVRVNVKTAFVLLSKIREVLVRNANLTPLSGAVQIDGAHFCAKPRKPNRRRKITAAEVSERLSAHKAKRGSQPPKVRMSKRSAERLKNRRVILVAREISPNTGDGATRSIVGVAFHENEAAGMGFAKRVVAPGATVWTDENAAYNKLSTLCQHETVNHSMEFVSDDGVNDNQCESFNSRMRRAEYGVFHGFRPKYLADYLWEFAWRDDNRRTSLRTRLIMLLNLALNSGRSQWWRGYWQGVHRDGELLFRLGHRQLFLAPDDPLARARTSFPR